MYQYQYLYFIKLLIVIFVKIFHINDQRKVFFFIQNLNELIFIFVFLSIILWNKHILLSTNY